MGRRTTLQRHRLIISKLRRTPCTFEQLQDFLQRESELSEDDLTCSIRTFQRDIRAISSLYHIEIRCDRSRNTYEIVEDENEDHNERLLEAFEIYNALDLSSNFARQVIVEKRKVLGTENLHGLLHAIRNGFSVKFFYEKYSNGDNRERTVNPVAIKEAQNRWYLLGQDQKDLKVKSFGLDRISDLQITRQTFDPIDYDPEKEYHNSFGIINGVKEKPQKIVLSFTPTEGKYINSLPLHHSQREILKNEDEWRFEYLLLPTHDFIMEVLSYGADVKVVAPKSFRSTIVEHLQQALEQYN